MKENSKLKQFEKVKIGHDEIGFEAEEHIWEELYNKYLYELPDDWSYARDVKLKPSDHRGFDCDYDAILFFKNHPTVIVEIKPNGIFDKDETFWRVKRKAEISFVRYVIICTPGYCLFGDEDPKNSVDIQLIEWLRGIEDHLSSTSCDTFKDIRSEWNKILKDVGDFNTKSDVIEFIDSIRFEDHVNGFFSMDDESERGLFKKLLGEPPNELCRYTSLKSIFDIVYGKKHSMCGIAGLNDRSETYYATDRIYGSKWYLSTAEGRNSQNRCEDRHDVAIPEKANREFVTCCCKDDKSDDLTMFRLYGDNAQGVCIKYKVDERLLENDEFFLAPVSYAQDNNSHPELDFVGKILMKEVNNRKLNLVYLDAWLHFFKPYDYALENEIRLFYYNRNQKKETDPEIIWFLGSYNIITPSAKFNIELKKNKFPLVIDEIILGPTMKEKNTNKHQLKYLLDNSNVYKVNSKTIVSVSRIDNYRV